MPIPLTAMPGHLPGELGAWGGEKRLQQGWGAGRGGQGEDSGPYLTQILQQQQ